MSEVSPTEVGALIGSKGPRRFFREKCAKQVFRLAVAVQSQDAFDMAERFRSRFRLKQRVDVFVIEGPAEVQQGLALQARSTQNEWTVVMRDQRQQETLRRALIELRSVE